MIEYRIAISLILLLYVSFLDIKSREVEDKIWKFFILIGLLFFGYEIISTGIALDWQLDPIIMIVKTLDWQLVPISIVVTFVIAYILNYLGFYGGADAMALITLSFILPVFNSPLYLHPLAPLIVLTNAMVLVMALPVYYFIRNSYSLIKGDKIFSKFEDEPIWKKIVVSFIGYRLKNVKEDDFYLPLEKSVGGKKKFDISLLKDDEDFKFLQGKDIWGTPGIPLLLFLAGGFIAMLLFGDIVAILLSRIISMMLPI